MKHGIPVAASAAILALALAGCAPGSAPSGGTDTGAIETDGTKMGEVTVTILDSFTDDASPIGRWMTSVVEQFEAEYPNITIDRDTQNSNDINATLRLRLADSATPDIVPANQGWSGVGDLAGSGLLLNLDAYSEAYGWEDALPDTILQQSKASTDGTNIGQGSLFGVPINQGAFITVFYNRAILEDLGLSQPTTFDEFTEAMDAALAAGIIPMQLGTQDGWPASATLLAIQAATGSGDSIRDFVFADGDVSAEATGLVESAATYQEWVEAGYFTPDFVGVPSADATQNFVDGEGLFCIWYSGFLPFADQAQGDQFGQFILPRVDGGPITAVGSSSQNFSIAANSDAADASALFLDFMASAAAGDAALENIIIPMFGTFEPNYDSALLNDGIVELNEVTASNGYLPYFDWSTPTMLDVLTQQLQLMFDGQVTPEDLAAAVQTDFDAFRADK